MAKAPRSIAAWVFRNFIKSITPKSRSGTVVGKDHLGTVYYEIPADPQGGKRRPSRWFQTVEKEKFDQDVPVEWEAWLRGRRVEPPTQEEIDANNALAQMKKIRAKELEENVSGTPQPEIETTFKTGTKSAFPTYDDYNEDNTQPHESKAAKTRPKT